MTDSKIVKICNNLSVCVSCFEKVQEFFKNSRHTCCYVCFQPCPDYDLVDLRWIGDRQVICCGKGSCLKLIRDEDQVTNANESRI